MLNIIICVVLLYFIIYYSIPPDFQVSMIYSVNVFIITLRLYFAGLSSLKYARDVIDHFAVSESLYDRVTEVKVIDSGINLSDHCSVVMNLCLPANKVYSDCLLYTSPSPRD